MNTIGATSTDSASLTDLNATIGTGNLSFWRRAFAFAGPAYLVSVGYMDPGNWATDLEGGARFGYRLLWVLVLSNLMAILLQTMSARLGIVWQRDLAQACRETYPRPIALTLWVFCEIAIAACDLAEVLGTAIGLNLLFHIPLLIGVILTAADTLLLLWFTNMGIRLIEAFVLSLITVIAGCFLVEILWARPALGDLANGIIPRLNGQSLLHRHRHPRRHGDAAQSVPALRAGADTPHWPNGIGKAHRLPLQSDRFRGRPEWRDAGQRRHPGHVRGGLFHPAPHCHGNQAGLRTPHSVMGTAMASILFAIALLCSGQSSTLTGTMAGQVVMEGFLNFRMRPWLRRLITRMLAVIPAALVIYTAGRPGYLSAHHSQPGDSQPAVAFRDCAACAFHQ